MYSWLQLRLDRCRFTLRRLSDGQEEVYDSVTGSWRRRCDVGLGRAEYLKLGAVTDFDSSELGPWSSDLVRRPGVSVG